MISYFSGCIVRMLLKNDVIQRSKFEIYAYGFEIFISSCLTLLIALSLGALLQCISASIIYFLIFAAVRQVCGGYHAKEYWSCNLIFTFTTALVLLFFKYVPVELFEISHYIFIGLWILSVFSYAPIENKNKPFNEHQKVLFCKISRCLCVLLSLISCLIYILQNQYVVLLDATLLIISLSILAVGLREKGGEIYEKESEKKCSESNR